jgi:hypothetical protein
LLAVFSIGNGVFSLGTCDFSLVRFLTSAKVLFFTLLLPSSVVSSISDGVAVLEVLGVLGDSMFTRSPLVLLLLFFKGLLDLDGHVETDGFVFDIGEEDEGE